MSARELPAAVPRVETGPVRFGDDWPGVFIRGDNAFGWLLALDHVLSGGFHCGIANGGQFDQLQKALLVGLRDELAACVEGPLGAELCVTGHAVTAFLESDDGRRAVGLANDLRKILERRNLLKPGVSFGGFLVKS
jgi:hypothetical protein